MLNTLKAKEKRESHEFAHRVIEADCAPLHSERRVNECPASCTHTQGY